MPMTQVKPFTTKVTWSRSLHGKVTQRKTISFHFAIYLPLFFVIFSLAPPARAGVVPFVYFVLKALNKTNAVIRCLSRQSPPRTDTPIILFLLPLRLTTVCLAACITSSPSRTLWAMSECTLQCRSSRRTCNSMFNLTQVSE